MAHRIHIPTVGDKLVLAEPWTFTLYYELRNKKMFEMAIPVKDREGGGYGKSGNSLQLTFPTGWELKVTRVYIRQGRPGYDSISFMCPYNGKNVRFWVKLQDVNKMIVAEESEHDD